MSAENKEFIPRHFELKDINTSGAALLRRFNGRWPLCHEFVNVGIPRLLCWNYGKKLCNGKEGKDSILKFTAMTVKSKGKLMLEQCGPAASFD